MPAKANSLKRAKRTPKAGQPRDLLDAALASAISRATDPRAKRWLAALLKGERVESMAK